MRPAPSPSSAATTAAPADGVAASDPAAAGRLPLLVLFLGAAAWLLVSSVFALLASLRFHSPNFLADAAWLTYGRLRPAADSALLYGCCVPAGLGLTLWLLARLGRTGLAQTWLGTLGAAVWNLAVLLGTGGILAGDQTGFTDLPLPRYATPLLLLGYLLLASWAALIFHQRRERQLYVSQWFLFAALFWFAWILSTAQLLLITFPVRGVVQSVVAWWYGNNLRQVWLWLVGLAVVFYLLPKLARSRFHSRYLALLAFWMIILFGSWGGIPATAPVPAWMPVLSSIGTVLTVIPLLAVALSVWGTLTGPDHGTPEIQTTKTPPSNELRTFGSRNSDFLRTSNFEFRISDPVALGFLLLGVLLFLKAGLLRILGAFLAVGRFTDLSWFTAAREQLNAYGFFVIVSFGAIYWLLPRLLGLEFKRPGLIRAHFWLAAAGLPLAVIPLGLAGLVQGLRLQDPNIPFLDVTRATLPFLRASTLGDLLLVLANALFLLNLAGLVLRFCRARAASFCATATADLFQPAEVKP